MSTTAPINRTVFRFFVAVLLFLIVFNSTNYATGQEYVPWVVTHFFHFGFDDNFTAWFSSMLFFAAGVVCLECYGLAVAQGLKRNWSLLALCALLVLMSADEVAQIHETLGIKLKELWGMEDLWFMRHVDWPWLLGIPLMIVFATVGWSVWGLLGRAPGSRKALAWGFGVILIGGVGLEISSTWMNHEEGQWIWDIEMVLEESLEMFGSLLFMHALMVWRNHELAQAAEA